MAFHLLHGTDYFRLERQYRALLAKLKRDPSGIAHFDGIDHPPSVTDLYQSSFSGSLFGPSSAVVLTNASAWIKHEFKGGKEPEEGAPVARGKKAGGLDTADLATLHDLTHPPDDITVIFADFGAELPKLPQKVWKTIDDGAGRNAVVLNLLKFIPFAPNPELEGLIGGFAKEFPGLKLGDDAVRALGWRCGSDLGTVHAELGKYHEWQQAHPGEAVTATLVERETPPVVDVYIFDLIDAIAARQLKKALSLMHLVLQGGEPAAKVIVLIHRQYKLMFWAILAQADGDNVAKRIGQAPWMVQKLIRTGSAYNRRQVPQVFRLIIETDRAIKTSAMPSDLALEVLVTKLCTL